MLLCGYYVFVKTKQDMMVGKLILKEHHYITENIDVINNSSEGYQELLSTYCGEVLLTLRKYELQQFWSIKDLPDNLFIWKRILKTQIYDYHFQKDKKEMKDNEHMQICIDIIESLQEIHEIYPKIYKKLLGKEEQNGYLFRVITNNINVCWKKSSSQGRRLAVEYCKCCEEKWEKPVQHLLFDCVETRSFFENTRSSGDEPYSPLICNGQITINELKRRCSILYKILKKMY
ncbi:hypothetical protein RFI_22331 [Reticulomyxa filosa]|uniref:Uncharacterized protein n=1 Tax=Reticulomyxa filosa TaxID=46433 RepID=X6MLZ4_RETFI|nr:hypothetical protein RFI_22331 [Reticulomyxa filosa]|eukprot:ETO15033.1 hypothetical protein RFI_22331 [Reticulomyxa filosa]